MFSKIALFTAATGCLRCRCPRSPGWYQQLLQHRPRPVLQLPLRERVRARKHPQGSHWHCYGPYRRLRRCPMLPHLCHWTRKWCLLQQPTRLLLKQQIQRPRCRWLLSCQPQPLRGAA